MDKSGEGVSFVENVSLEMSYKRKRYYVEIDRDGGMRIYSNSKTGERYIDGAALDLKRWFKRWGKN